VSDDVRVIAFQRLLVLIQRFNSVAFAHTPTPDEFYPFQHIFFVLTFAFKPRDLYYNNSNN